MDLLLPAGRSPLTIEQSARTVGAAVWAERYLYEVVGGWVASAVNPSVKVFLDASSQHHAWRAELWLERLPARLVQAYPGDGVPQPPADLLGPGPERVAAALAALGGLEGDSVRVGVYCRVVLTRAMVAYRAWQRRCSTSSDRPVARVLSLVLSDVLADWQEAAGTLVGLLEGPEGEKSALEVAGATTEIDRLLIGKGLVANA
jgi:hypothetical protein